MDVKKNLIVDAVALVVYLVVANPFITGITLHEWLGIGLVVVFLVHVAMHLDWAADAIRSALKNPSLARTGNLVLDILILVCFLVVTISGLGISGDFLRTFGLFADGYYLWNLVHAIAAKVLLAFLAVHIVVHAKWLYTFIKRAKDAGTADYSEADGATVLRKADEHKHGS